MPMYRRPIPGNSSMWNLADSMFSSFNFVYLLSPSFSCVDVLKVLMPLNFYSFPFFIFCACLCKVSCPHFVVCCIKFFQRSIRGSCNTKRLGITDDNAILTFRNWSSPWGKPLNETYQELSRLQHYPERALGDSLVPLATLGESSLPSCLLLPLPVPAHKWMVLLETELVSF